VPRVDPAPLDLDGRCCVITGASAGIGRVTAASLARRGARVLMLGRSPEKHRAVIEEILAAAPGARVELVPCDLADLASVRAAALRVLELGAPITWLINNAGVAGVRGLTADGFELAFGTNHLAHFVLTEHLRPRLASTPGARVVNVASGSHFHAAALDLAAVRGTTRSVTGLPEYAVSKLANVLHARDLAAAGLDAFSLNPGRVGTEIWSRRLGGLVGRILGLFMLTPEQGARTTLHCALAPGLEAARGAYFDDCRERTPSRLALDPALPGRLRAFSLEATAPFLPAGAA
jgi:NAD(P)-dependent dehydrogenase (short-subunit alcohol dehydrogenase family)